MMDLKPIESFKRQKLNLWIIHADKIPPHIGISFNGLFYSLKFNGKDLGVEVDTLLHIFRKKGTPIVVMEIDELPIRDLASVFSEFDKATSNGNTCLDPVCEVLGMDRCETIHTLISSLIAENKIVELLGFNLPPAYSGIPNYSRSVVIERLKSLET